MIRATDHDPAGAVDALRRALRRDSAVPLVPSDRFSSHKLLARTLLQVKINHADEADEIFATLMGDVVEPRREFIQDNALKVANLDV